MKLNLFCYSLYSGGMRRSNSFRQENGPRVTRDSRSSHLYDLPFNPQKQQQKENGRSGVVPEESTPQQLQDGQYNVLQPDGETENSGYTSSQTYNNPRYYASSFHSGVTSSSFGQLVKIAPAATTCPLSAPGAQSISGSSEAVPSQGYVSDSSSQSLHNRPKLQSDWYQSSTENVRDNSQPLRNHSFSQPGRHFSQPFHSFSQPVHSLSQPTDMAQPYAEPARRGFLPAVSETTFHSNGLSQEGPSGIRTALV